MSTIVIGLSLATIVWSLVIYLSLPLFSLHLARKKREFVLTQVIGGSLVLTLMFLTKGELHVLSFLSFCLFSLSTGVMFFLLKRLDYYIDDLLHELLLVNLVTLGTSFMSVIWYWAVIFAGNLLYIRLALVVICLLLMLAGYLFRRSSAMIWSMAVFVVVTALKWLIMPYWGLWSIILVYGYAVFLGYVVEWMLSTTNAEMRLSWNIAPAKVWVILVVITGVLVIAF